MAGFVATLAVMGVVVPYLPLPVAQAQAPPSCMDNGDYGQVGGREDPGASQSDDSRGSYSQIYIVYEAWCQRISSIYVFSPSLAGWFEFGYLVGYSNCPGYTDHFFEMPTLFYWSRTVNGTHRCRVWENRHPVSGQYDAFRASDINANTYWGSYFNGEELQPGGINMDFARGWNYLGMERGHRDDGGFAQFNELQEFHDGNDWTRWDDLTACCDTDPDFHLDIVNAYTGRVVQ